MTYKILPAGIAAELLQLCKYYEDAQIMSCPKDFVSDLCIAYKELAIKSESYRIDKEALELIKEDYLKEIIKLRKELSEASNSNGR